MNHVGTGTNLVIAKDICGSNLPRYTFVYKTSLSLMLRFQARVSMSFDKMYWSKTGFLVIIHILKNLGTHSKI